MPLLVPTPRNVPERFMDESQCLHYAAAMKLTGVWPPSLPWHNSDEPGCWIPVQSRIFCLDTLTPSGSHGLFGMFYRNCSARGSYGQPTRTLVHLAIARPMLRAHGLPVRTDFSQRVPPTCPYLRAIILPPVGQSSSSRDHAYSWTAPELSAACAA